MTVVTITSSELADYCGADNDSDILRSLVVAEALVSDTFSQAWREVPEEVIRQVTLEVGKALYKRRDETSGNGQSVEFGTGAAVQGPKDPFAQVWPIVRRYVLPL